MCVVHALRDRSQQRGQRIQAVREILIRQDVVRIRVGIVAEQHLHVVLNVFGFLLCHISLLAVEFCAAREGEGRAC